METAPPNPNLVHSCSEVAMEGGIQYLCKTTIPSGISYTSYMLVKQQFAQCGVDMLGHFFFKRDDGDVRSDFDRGPFNVAFNILFDRVVAASFKYHKRGLIRASVNFIQDWEKDFLLSKGFIINCTYTNPRTASDIVELVLVNPTKVVNFVNGAGNG